MKLFIDTGNLKEIESLVRSAEARAREILEAHRTALDRLAEALLEREEILGEEVNRLVFAEDGDEASDAANN